MVNRTLSLSRQVVQEILTGIDAGTLPRDNGMLPSETEMSQRFDVSRATIREALSQLEQRGVVLRKHGVGTFVAHQTLFDAGLEELASLETLARRIGTKTQMGDPAVIEERKPTLREANLLQISPDAFVLAVSRVIKTSERLIAYLIDIVPTNILCQQDLAKNFRGSVLDVLLRRKDLRLSHSRTDILIESASKEIASKLSVRPGTALHKLEAQLIARDGRVIDYSTSYLVPECFHLHVNRKIRD
jgi:GntR family transcriptional regulator